MMHAACLASLLVPKPPWTQMLREVAERLAVANDVHRLSDLRIVVRGVTVSTTARLSELSDGTSLELSCSAQQSQANECK